MTLRLPVTSPAVLKELALASILFRDGRFEFDRGKNKSSSCRI